jgi:hypothetical protein
MALAQLRGAIVDAIAAHFGATDAARPPGAAMPPTTATVTETTDTALDTPALIAPATAAARAALDDATLARALGAIDLGLFGEAAPGLRGDLRVVPLAEVLHLLDAQEQSGALTVERSGARVDIYFRRGRVAQAIASGGPEELLLGSLMVDAGLMQRGDLDAVLAMRTSQPIGQQLIELGRLGEAELRACLTRQSSELIYEILRWRHGRFRFAAGADLPPSVIDASLGLDVEAVLMEGYRRVDEWHLIERAIDNFDIVFLRNEDAVAQMGRGRLTRDELVVLELVNGKHTVQEIIRKSRMRSFEVSKMLYRLLSIKLIRRRVQPVAV